MFKFNCYRIIIYIYILNYMITIVYTDTRIVPINYVRHVIYIPINYLLYLHVIYLPINYLLYLHVIYLPIHYL